MGGQAEKLLHPDGQDGRVAVIVDRYPAAGRRVEMGRRKPVELARKIVRHPRHQSRAQSARIDTVERSLAAQVGQQPVIQTGQQGGVVHLRPGLARRASQP